MTPRLRGRQWQNICAQVYAAHTYLVHGKPTITCHLCGEPIDPTLRWPNKWSKSVDHVVTLHDDGTNALANLRPAHLTHNSSRGSRPVKMRTSVEW